MTTYALSINFKSNERPFSTIYEPYPKNRFGDDDAAAIDWARYMRDNMPNYSVTLIKNGEPLQIPDDED